MLKKVLNSKLPQMVAMLGVAAALIIAMPSRVNPVVEAAAEISGTGVISVTGKGSVKVKPDIAYITLGVTTNAKDAKTAQNDNAVIMTAVYTAVKVQGVSEDDLATMNYSIWPEYYYNYDYSYRSEIIGYNVSNSIQITVRNIDNVSAVLDAAVAAGANSGGQIQFSLANPDDYYNQALVQALKNAESKATVLAGVIGINLEKPSLITEAQTYNAPYSTSPVAANDMSGGKESAPSVPTPIEKGDLQITANVNVEYRY